MQEAPHSFTHSVNSWLLVDWMTHHAKEPEYRLVGRADVRRRSVPGRQVEDRAAVVGALLGRPTMGNNNRRRELRELFVRGDAADDTLP